MVRSSVIGAFPVPISPYLDGFPFDAEAKRVMGIAFEMIELIQSPKRLPRASSSLPKTASAIPIGCVMGH